MFLKSGGRYRISLARNSRFFHSLERRAVVVTKIASNNHCAVVPSQRVLFSSLPSRKNEDDKNDTENNKLVAPDSPIDFAVSSKIEGEESQIATIQLQPGEKLRAESGAMLFMTQGVEMATNLEGVSSAFRRMMTGQNFFLTDFTYNGKGSGTVGLGTDFPSKILRMSLKDHGGSLIAQRGAYLASNASVDIQMEFTRTMTAGFFGGQGFVLQRLVGEGDVLIKAGGTLVERYLEEGEVLRATSGSVVAFEPAVSYDIQMMQGVKNVMFGGEGLFVTSLTGPGKVWLQGMPPDRMIAEISSRVPSRGGIGPIIPIGGIGGEAAPVDAGVPNAEDDTTLGEETAAAMDEGASMDTDSTSTMTSSDMMEGDASMFSNTIGESGDAFQETTFTDDGADFIEPSFQDDTSFDGQSSDDVFGEQAGDFFEDDSTEIFDTGATEEVSEAGSNLLSTLWDIFTGGD